MAQSISKDEILHEMNQILPFKKLSKSVQLYVEEAMSIYAKQEAIAFAHWLEYNPANGRNTEELYTDFLEEVS